MSLLRVTHRGIWLVGLIGLAPALPSMAADGPVWVGTGSCAATACHGGRQDPPDLKGAEYSFWGAYDPHNKAFSYLYDDRSKLIEKNFRRLVDVDVARPYQDDLCLKCHVHQGFDSRISQGQETPLEVADGVGCESCHGAGGNYLTRHVEAGWRGLNDRQKFEMFGMRPTKDLLARGQMCAECHVGQGTTEVNHDLIAAGHPRLNFEYGSQLAKVPKHWRARDDQARNPDHEAKVWALGQILTAKASIELLESRATRSIPEDSTTPWPELSESSCFSCHHELVVADWRQANPWPNLKAGALPWATWSTPMLKTITRTRPDLAETELQKLGELMNRPLPDASKVARQAHVVADRLGRRAEQLNREVIVNSQVKAWLSDILQPDGTAPPLDWDQAAQQYLAIVALDKAMARQDPRYAGEGVQARLDQLRGNLNLPLRVERRGGIFDSPYHYDPKKIYNALQAVRSAQPNP